MEERGREESGSSDESPPSVDDPERLPTEEKQDEGGSGREDENEEILDVSGKKGECQLLDTLSPGGHTVSELYIYKNTFNLIPSGVERLTGLKTLKFFANEVNVFPPEMCGMTELERLQVKVSSPEFGGFELQKLKELKELELCRAPPRPSAVSILCGLANLSCLTRLSVCHFSIRYLPPEIGSLRKLECLDLSFNKLKSLPDDIAELTSLKSLRVACNKLVGLPVRLSSLDKLETLDLSNNRLSSLQPLKLSSMQSLRLLDLQYNKIYDCQRIPSWIHCNMEGNGSEAVWSGVDSSVSEVDVPDVVDGVKKFHSDIGRHRKSSSTAPEAPSNSRFISRRIRKDIKHSDCPQEKARQERLNNSRKLKPGNRDEPISSEISTDFSGGTAGSDALHLDEKRKKQSEAGQHSTAQHVSSITKNLPCTMLDSDLERSSEVVTHNQADGSQLLSDNGFDECADVPCTVIGDCKEDGYESGSNHQNHCVFPRGHLNEINSEDSRPCEKQKCISKSKRHSDKAPENPKPSKCRRPVDDSFSISFKYSNESFCGVNDRLPDGFYDAGRGRPFMPLENCDQGFCVDSREIILVDRGRDEELDAIALSAQSLLSRLRHARRSSGNKRMHEVDDFVRASVLALFVSDFFGGSDQTTNIVRMRKAVAVSNRQQPFICTCSNAINQEDKGSYVSSTKDSLSISDLCEQSVQQIKERDGSNIVPIGSLQFGICRHRAILMKYLCDRADPPIPCELVRGYLDFMPHAWNVILIQDDGSWRRMVVDACYPADMREEIDPEYFCRYIPLNRFHVPVTSLDYLTMCRSSFPSVSLSDAVSEKESGPIVKRCMFGTIIAAAKIHTLEAHDSSEEERRNFEYGCLGEVRMLQAVKGHPCIVGIYGHQISAEWDLVADGKRECCLLKSMIVMEYVKGGSLKAYMDKLVTDGKKHLPARLALFIARDVACALAELHSKHIIHRDIKSLNVLIDLDEKRVDGSPLVKLCDFDRAVPLHSFSHTCCLAHLGIPSPTTCVGTPCWMAPEMVQTVHKKEPYGLEVDIWSYGCLLYEMLMLQVPYAGLSDAEIEASLQNKQRPLLRSEFEELSAPSKSKESSSGSSPQAVEDSEIMKLLVDLFRWCTQGDPAARPTAKEANDMLSAALSPPNIPESS
ncbi:cAMP-dependent protein kinase type 1 [Nymphaea thermarum]|nr:cAMP-dependent protein kinase type 1 [Nymphaea thermarum]